MSEAIFFPTAHYSPAVGTTGSTLQALIGSTINIGICKHIYLQCDPGNAGTIILGGMNTTTATTNYGIVLPIPSTTLGPAAPLPFEASHGLLSPAMITLRAANTTDKIHVFIIK